MNSQTLQHVFIYWICLTLLAACSNSENNKHKPIDQVLTLNIYTEPPTLDPGKALDQTSTNLIGLLFEGLTRISSSDNTPKLAIAQSLEISPDGKVYTFRLRDSAWSNGDALTAQDFEYAWKRALSPSFPGDFTYQMYVIKNAREVKQGKISVEELGVKALDSHTLQVQLLYPTPYFLELLSLPCFLPVHQETVKDNEHWAYEAGPLFISNGPFHLSSWTHHNKLDMDRNPHYWDAAKVRLQHIHLLMIEDSNTELGLFESDAIDWTGRPVSIGLPTDAIPTLKKTGKLESCPLGATYCYLFNTERAPFQNTKMRQAFALAIQRNAIVNSILQGDGLPATGLVPPPLSLQNTAFFEDSDVQKAQQLFHEALQEMGSSIEELPPILLSYNTNEAHHKIAQAIQQQWEQTFGIRVLLENLEWKVYLDKLQQKDYTIARLSLVAHFNDPVTFLSIFKYSNDVMNMTGWENTNYVDFLDQAKQEPNATKRRRLLLLAEQTLIEDMPIIPVYYLKSSFMKNNALKNVYISPTGWIDFKEAYFD